MSLRICCDGPDRCTATRTPQRNEPGWVHIPKLENGKDNVLRPEKHLCPKCVRKLLDAEQRHTENVEDIRKRLRAFLDHLSYPTMSCADVVRLLHREMGWVLQ